jgi:hypothetical protein
MITNSDFNFKKNEIVTLELPFSEHIEELRQRIFHIFWIILLLTCFAFFEVKFLVKCKIFSTFPGWILCFYCKNFFLYGSSFWKPFCNRTINFIFITWINQKRNKNYLTIIVKFFMSLCVGLSFFVLCLNSSRFKFFFKL